MNREERWNQQKQYESPGMVMPRCYDLMLRDGFKMLNGVPLDENDIRDYHESLDDNTDFFGILHPNPAEPKRD